MNNFIRNYANIPNPVTKFFNKINYVRLIWDYSKQIELLEAMKKVPLYVENIEIPSINTEELENLTDPNLHNIPINNLILKLESFKFSSKTIENLQTIHPNSIKLFDCSSYKDGDIDQDMFENFTKLLSKLDRTSLEMNFLNEDYRAKLEFRNVIFKLVESKKECSYIRAKSVEIRCRDEDYWRIK